MGKVMARLRELDHRALNSWWGLLVVPFAWLAYRLGRHAGGPGGKRWAYLGIFGPEGALFHKGAQEGKPLPPLRGRRKG